MKSLEVALRVGSSRVSAEPSGITLVDSTPDSLSLLMFRSRRLLPNTSSFASGTLVRNRLRLRFSSLDGSAEPFSLPVLAANVNIAAICTLLSPPCCEAHCCAAFYATTQHQAALLAEICETTGKIVRGNSRVSSSEFQRTASLRLRERCVRRSEEHTSELQSPCNLVCRLLLEKKNTTLIVSPPYWTTCTPPTA